MFRMISIMMIIKMMTLIIMMIIILRMMNMRMKSKMDINWSVFYLRTTDFSW